MVRTTHDSSAFANFKAVTGEDSWMNGIGCYNAF
jgi:hypothetical protein